MSSDVRSALNDRQKSALRWLACNVGGRPDRRAIIEQTELSQADCEYLIHLLERRGGLKVVPDATKVTSGHVEILAGIQALAEELDSQIWQPKSERQPSPATMDLLISWSKTKSRQLASELYRWLPFALPDVKPWMSDKDIDKGTEWFGELQSYLGQAKACIIVVTEENVRSPWLYYEAGAIATKGPDVRVYPYLVGVDPRILADGPLSKFQCTVASKDDTLALILSINKRLSIPHNEQLLKQAFAANWQTLEAELGRIDSLATQNPADFVHTAIDELAGTVLSSEARTLLIEGSQDSTGTIRTSKSKQGSSISTNGKILLAFGAAPREITTWEESMTELMDRGLLEYKSDAVSSVTVKGYKVADKLRELPSHRDLDENDIICLLEGHLAQHEVDPNCWTGFGVG